MFLQFVIKTERLRRSIKDSEEDPIVPRTPSKWLINLI